MERGSEVRAKDFKFGIVYSFGRNLDPDYSFILLKIDGDTLFISGNDFIGVEGILFTNETDPYYFDRELTDLTKALL